MALDPDVLDMRDPMRAARFLASMEYPVEQIVAYLEGADFDGDPVEVAENLVRAFRACQHRSMTTSLVEEDEEDRAAELTRLHAAEFDC